VDTRTKISDRAPENARVVSGYFDPLLAWHVRRLAALKKEGTPLLVLIEEPPDPVLPARARAELVAALSVTDHVMLASERTPAPSVRLVDEERSAYAALIERIQAHRRNGT
jgi:hypothetical protein